VLAEAGGTIERFFASGVMELKDKLGPINWQLAPTKEFEPADFEAFLKLLPKEVKGRAVRHVVEVRHDSFRSRDFIALVREHGVAVSSRANPLTRKSPMPLRPSSTPASWERRRLQNWVIRMPRLISGPRGESLGLRGRSGRP